MFTTWLTVAHRCRTLYDRQLFAPRRFLWQYIRTDPAARLCMSFRHFSPVFCAKPVLCVVGTLCLIGVFRIVIMLPLPLFFIGSLYTCVWLMYHTAWRARSSGLSAEYLIRLTLGRLFFML